MRGQGKAVEGAGKVREGSLGLIMRMKVSKTVHLLNPLEVLNVAEIVTDIESVMLDQVHLLSGCYDMIVEEAGRIVEGWKARKRFPDDKIKPDAKRHKTGPTGGARRVAVAAKSRALRPAATAVMPEPRSGKSGIPDRLWQCRIQLILSFFNFQSDSYGN
jgi:hypothetical protein